MMRVEVEGEDGIWEEHGKWLEDLSQPPRSFLGPILLPFSVKMRTGPEAHRQLRAGSVQRFLV